MSTEYPITWTAKPLGFSIVMDTTGKNAYVSSIQKEDNLRKGLKLAAQIVSINGTDVRNMKHSSILEVIRKATLPMTLVFQPRSFANEPKEGAAEVNEEKKSDGLPKCLLLGGSPHNQHRVCGIFDLQADETINDRAVWKRRDAEKDNIIIYWLLGSQVKNSSAKLPDMWMIARRSKVYSDQAYACCEDDQQNPLVIKQPWQIWSQDNGKFEKCELKIQDEVDSNEAQLN